MFFFMNFLDARQLPSSLAPQKIPAFPILATESSAYLQKKPDVMELAVRGEISWMRQHLAVLAQSRTKRVLNSEIDRKSRARREEGGDYRATGRKDERSLFQRVQPGSKLSPPTVGKGQPSAAPTPRYLGRGVEPWHPQT